MVQEEHLNQLQATPTVESVRSYAYLVCTDHEYDEDTDDTVVTLVEDGLDPDKVDRLRLPMPTSMAGLFVIGETYEVSLDIQIPVKE